MDLVQRCLAIELVVADVDGVLTDGHVILDSQGIEARRFHVRDGLGIRLWHKAGYRFGLITSRSSHMVKLRAVELGIDLIRQGSEDRLATLRGMMRELRLSPEQVCYLGDDLPDVPAIRAAGLGVAVADACPEALAAAAHVTAARGGHGAVRETIELILKSQRRWEDVIHTLAGS